MSLKYDYDLPEPQGTTDEVKPEGACIKLANEGCKPGDEWCVSHEQLMRNCKSAADEPQGELKACWKCQTLTTGRCPEDGGCAPCGMPECSDHPHIPCDTGFSRLGNTRASVSSGATDGEKMYMALARSVIRRIFEADANCDPPLDVLLRLESIIRERDALKAERTVSSGGEAEALAAAYHRGVDAAKQAIRDECDHRDGEGNYYRATCINAIARKCGLTTSIATELAALRTGGEGGDSKPLEEYRDEEVK